MIIHADKNIFNKEVLTSESPVLVDFYADWCGPCKMQARILENLGLEFADKKIYKINVDEESDIAGDYGIQSIPTLLVFKNGKVEHRVSGVTQEAGLKRMLGM